MSPGSAFGDEKRTRSGLVFLVGGTLLVVWAWGSWIFRTTGPPEAPGEVINSGAPSEAAGAGGSMAGVGLAALAGLALVGYLLLRRSRRRTARRDVLCAFPGDSSDPRFSKDPRQDSG